MAEYIITDGTRFIRRDHKGRYMPVSNESLADTFSKTTADKIFSNSLPKALRTIFRVEKYDTPPKDVKQATKEDMQSVEKVMVTENIQKWLDKISDLNGLAQDATNRKEELNRQLSEVDKEICDCMHYIEFCNLNAAQGYKAYRMLKERRIRRRTIKNELAVLDIILGKRISESITDEILRQVQGLDGRTYEPRVLKELFDI